MSDEMPMDIGGQLRYLTLQFLHPTLPEMPFARFVRFTNRFDGLELTYAYERYMRRYMRAYLIYLLSNHVL